ncbi:MAG: TlpA family protein disulfide reductase [Rhodospirillales bacterium]|nr:TlpA family protein disulfide reductase [Rhodospirillales bacterium]
MTEITCAVDSGDGQAKAALGPGDAVPSYGPKWIKGGPVAWSEPGRLYLIECWATWCGPCRATIPHVDALHRKYGGRGLTVIGQNVWEEDQEAVAAFVREQADAMSYPVAADDGAFVRDWMTPAGVQGIPHAFLVRDGRLFWQCHPQRLDDATVESMLDGRFDVAGAAREMERQRGLYADAEARLEARDWTGLRATLDVIERELGDEGAAFAKFHGFAVLAGTGQFDLVAEALRGAMAGDESAGGLFPMLLTLKRLRIGPQAPVLMALELEAMDSLLAQDRHPGLLVTAAVLKGMAGRFADAVPLLSEALEATTQDGQAPAIVLRLRDAMLAGRVPPRADELAWDKEGMVPVPA